MAEVTIPQLNPKKMFVPLIGDTPMIMHRFAEKVLKDMTEKHKGKAHKALVPRNPEQEAMDSRHLLPDGTPGFPAGGFKKSCVYATRLLHGITMTAVRQMFFIEGIGPDQLVPIFGEESYRMDAVRLKDAARTATPRFRAQYDNWRAILEISYAGGVTEEQILNLLQHAGFGVGVGEWRPERDGAYGRYHIATIDELSMYPEFKEFKKRSKEIVKTESGVIRRTAA
jgi:hypothetical protein